MAAAIVGGLFLLALIWPRQREAPRPAPKPQARSGGGGAFLLLLVLGVGGLLLLAAAMPMDEMTSDYSLGGVDVVERADAHVETKHGTLARDVNKRPGSHSYYYSASRETVLVARCDTVNCACTFIGVRGMGINAATFSPAQIAGGLELSSYIMPATRLGAVIARDGYVSLGVY